MVAQLVDKPIHQFSTKNLGLLCFAPLIARTLQNNIMLIDEPSLNQNLTFSQTKEIPLVVAILSCFSGLLLFLGEININESMYYHY
jgi:hypothetical protein